MRYPGTRVRALCTDPSVSHGDVVLDGGSYSRTVEAAPPPPRMASSVATLALRTIYAQSARSLTIRRPAIAETVHSQ